MKEASNYQKGYERILGDGAFITEILEMAVEKVSDKHQLKNNGYNIDRMIKHGAEITQVTPEKILDSRRDTRRTKARSVLCYWEVEKLGITQSQLAQMLKRMQSAITYTARRAKALVDGNSYRLE